MRSKTKQRANRRAPLNKESRTSLAGSDRRNWTRLREHYTQRARAASDAGDRILAEHFYQHADHYLRLIQGLAA